MLILKALHIIAMVAWFAGLFYLPRLFMYHTLSTDQISITRFKIMERKLYWMIMMPAAILTSIFGLILLFAHYDYYSHLWWMHGKLICVMALWVYQLFCGYLLMQFKTDRNRFSSKFYRFFNEVPTVLLFGIVILVIVKP